MPSERLEKGKQRRIPRFAVCACYSEPHEDRFIRHVALLREEAELDFEATTGVWHVCPPIVAGEETSAVTARQFDECKVHAMAYIDDLAVDELQGIETTLVEIDAQTPKVRGKYFLHHYHVNPPIEWARDRKTNRRRYRKFSCVGFVQACYAEGAEIRLLNLESMEMPLVDLKTLVRAYGPEVGKTKLRERVGVQGLGPWRLHLAGYVLHALDRPSSEVRAVAYVPASIREASFPSEAGGGSAPRSGIWAARSILAILLITMLLVVWILLR